MVNKFFAWWPKGVTSGQQVWLKYYYEYENPHNLTSSLHSVWSETQGEKTRRLIKENIAHNRNVWNETILARQDKENNNVNGAI